MTEPADGEQATGRPPVPQPPIEEEDTIEYALRNSLVLDDVNETVKRATYLISRLQLVDIAAAKSAELPGLDIPPLHLPREGLDGGIKDSEAWVLEEISSATEPILVDTRVDGRRSCRLDLPVLASNHNIDTEMHLKDMEEKREASLRMLSIPFHPLEVENFEAIELPTRVKEFWQEMRQDDTIEELDDSILPSDHELANMASNMEGWSGMNLAKIVLDDSLKAATKAIEISRPMTPPLSPKPDDGSPFLPNEVASLVQFASDPPSLVDDDLKKAGEAFEAAETSKLQTVLNGDGENIDINMFLKMDDDLYQAGSPSSIRAGQGPTHEDARASISSLKMEAPIFKREESPKCISQPATASEAANLIKGLVPKSEPERRDAFVGDETVSDRDFNAFMAAEATKFKQKVEQEQLDVTRGTSRLLVPHVDVSIPRPYWDESHETPREHLAKHLATPSLLTWCAEQGLSRREERDMKWRFDGQTKKPSFEENIRTEEPVPAKFSEVKDEDILSLLGGKDRLSTTLRFLQDARNDDDLIEAMPARAPSHTLLSLDARMDSIRTTKHKMESHPEPSATKRPKTDASRQSNANIPEFLVDAHGSKEMHTHASDKVGSNEKSPVSVPSRSRDQQRQSLSKLPGLLLNTEGGNTTVSLLEKYLAIHEPDKVGPKKSSYFSAPSNSPSSGTIPKNAIPKADETWRPQQTKAKVPKYELPGPGRFIISLRLGFTLARRIEALYPAVELIDRDYAKYGASSWLPDPKASSAEPTNLSCEADISLSPVTGIIVTSLAMARQKPPAGSNGSTDIRCQTAHVSNMYERLIVLVSERNMEGEMSQKISPDDAKAYADFVAFAASLPTQVQVIYVGGAEGTMAKWIVALMCQYYHETAATRHAVVTETCSWETFLRLAGLNVYAAQIINFALTNSGRDTGIHSFLQMTEQERIRAFGNILGSRRLLQRLTAILDRKWGLGDEPEVIDLT